MMEVRPKRTRAGPNRAYVAPAGGGEHNVSRLPTSAAVQLAEPTSFETFDVRVRSSGRDGLTVEALGELDLATAELLSAVLGCHVGRRVVRLDVSGLTFVDCAGLRTIAAAHRLLAAHGGRLVLVGVGPRIQWLLHVTGIDCLFVADRPSDASG